MGHSLPSTLGYVGVINYVLIEVKAMPKALVGSPAEHSWCNLSNLNLSTARCQQFIARFMCISLNANIPSSFMSFSERFYSQFLRQMVTRLLAMTTTLLLESSNLSITMRDQIHHNQTHWALPLQVCLQWQITHYHRSKKWAIGLDIDAYYLACCSILVGGKY